MNAPRTSRWCSREWGPLSERVWRTLGEIDMRHDLAEAMEEYEEADRLLSRRVRLLRYAERIGETQES